MSSLKGTQTEKNLLTAFAGESQARNRYSYFASKAKKEGYVQIDFIFEETANQEKEHAKRFFKFLEGGEVEITGGFPAGKIGSTLENLKAAAAGEHYENTRMYPEFAHTARKEGFPEDCPDFRGRGRSREISRKKICLPGGQPGKQPGLSTGNRGGLALPQLRVYQRR